MGIPPRQTAPGKSHDLRLPVWGPYSKTYAGLSHIPDIATGLRFDLAVFPGLYRRRVDVANVNWEGHCHPWSATPDLNFYSFRHELEWKDRLYVDTEFTALSDSQRRVRAVCVNNTELPQTLVLHVLASMTFPPPGPYTHSWIESFRANLPEGATWTNALDYTDLRFARPRPSDHLVTDGQWRGEQRGHGYTDGSGIGCGWGKDAGDLIEYRINLPRTLSQATLVLRYRVAKPASGRLRCHIAIDQDHQLTLPGTGSFETASLPLGNLPAGELQLTIESLGGAAVDLDGFAIVDAAHADNVTFSPVIWNPAPVMREDREARTLLLKYEQASPYYGLAWDFPDFEVREILHSELDSFLRHKAHDHVNRVLQGDRQRNFTNLFMRPIALSPGETRILDCLVASGTEPNVREALTRFQQHPEPVINTTPTLMATANPAGKTFAFSQDRMAATVATNIVYPVYTQRQFIRHYTPGRWWDCLYTWDSGFLGLGLLELDIERAVDCLNAYLTEPPNPHAAFIHHGSVVPVQHYLYQAIWNRTQRRDLLERFYPSLRQYHRFLAGRVAGSTTRTQGSGLIRTFDYFYNSGGWDDYPPQQFVHTAKIAGHTTPAVNTSHAIRTAKLLRQAALELGITADLTEYDRDIAELGAALQHHSWDEKAGYFSYVTHDPQSLAPTGILRHPGSGANFNMGLDGASPLIAGSVTPAQRDRLLSHLKNDREIWCPIGLSTVDRSAPYYRHDGYWNGAVWMPHQWFFWRAMLDLNQPDFAWKIARTALELWKQEVEATYFCFEHFIIETGRGAGWHHFSGLSSPVLSWFSTYFKPGTLTTGLDGSVRQATWSDHNRRLEADLVLTGSGDAAGQAAVIACLAEGTAYTASWNGRALAPTIVTPGTLTLPLPANGEGKLVITRAD